MITIQGVGVSGGIGAGRLYLYHPMAAEPESRTAESPKEEWLRFQEARSAADGQLEELARKTEKEAGEAEAALFEAHRLLLADAGYAESVRRIILEEKQSAEAAVLRTGEMLAERFDAMEDECMRERAADLRDVSRRILNLLCGAGQQEIASDVPVILAAEELMPSETVSLDKSKIAGIVTARGSAFDHTAILARAMGIPAVVASDGLPEEAYAGQEAILDGETGEVLLEPDDGTRKRLLEKRERQQEERKQLETLKGKPDVTRDGQEIRVYCNIGSPADVPAVLRNDGSGIGLFRSEFLYLDRQGYPSEEEQFAAYRAVLVGMGGREVIIRTCDVGADKRAGYLGLPQEENPALGMRAIRISLDRTEIFKTQLRALYRASVFGRLRIMFPMITGEWEVREAKRLCDTVQKELAAEGIPYSEEVPLGIMIETPAAVMISDRLAKEVDFFSCGTNDLTQYTLACDRQNPALGRFYDTRHPAVLRMLKMVCGHAHRNGIRVGVCGELASDPEMAETFLALGVDELSVTPEAVLPLRCKIRSLDLTESREKILEELLS